MASVAEQLQTYRALYTNSRVVLKESASGMRRISFTHPRTMEYFRELNRRWQSGNREQTPAPARSVE